MKYFIMIVNCYVSWAFLVAEVKERDSTAVLRRTTSQINRYSLLC